MKLLYISFIFIGACAADSTEPEQSAPAKEKPVYHMPTPEPREDNRVVCRTVKLVVTIKDCKLYTFTCEDGSEDMYLSCSTHPIGEITNPPRPI